MEHTHLYQIVDKPTRGENCLDKLFVSDSIFEKVMVTPPTLKTDHRAIIAYNGVQKLPTNKIKTSHTIRIRKPKNTALFREELARNVIEYYEDKTFQKACDNMYKSMLEILNRYFPEKRITITANDPEFVTPYIKRLLRKKNKVLRKGQTKEAERITEEVGKLIIQHNSNKLKKCDFSADSRQLWK